MADDTSGVPERIWVNCSATGGQYLGPAWRTLEPRDPGTEYVTLAHAEAMVREALAQFAPHLAALPSGEWETWTSCSFRRISRRGRGGGDGDVLHAYNQRGDGHPDLSWTEEQCRAICAIVNGLRALAQPTEGRE